MKVRVILHRLLSDQEKEKTKNQKKKEKRIDLLPFLDENIEIFRV